MIQRIDFLFIKVALLPFSLQNRSFFFNVKNNDDVLSKSHNLTMFHLALLQDWNLTVLVGMVLICVSSHHLLQIRLSYSPNLMNVS